MNHAPVQDRSLNLLTSSPALPLYHGCNWQLEICTRNGTWSWSNAIYIGSQMSLYHCSYVSWLIPYFTCAYNTNSLFTFFHFVFCISNPLSIHFVIMMWNYKVKSNYSARVTNNFHSAVKSCCLSQQIVISIKTIKHHNTRLYFSNLPISRTQQARPISKTFSSA